MRLFPSTAESVRVWHRLLRLVFVPLGIALLAYSVWWSVSFLRVAVAAEGTVVALVEQRDEKSRIFYSPRIHYLTRNGDVAESIAPVGSFPAAFSVGEKVSILYDPQKLSRIRINRTSDLWGFTIVCAFGVVLSVILYLALGRYQKRLTMRATPEGTEQVDEPNGAPPHRLS